jgi:metallo-beta-lactamase family protein
VTATAERGGKLIIPSFALGRVEELLFWIKLLEDRRQIPQMPVYVDSPMASAVLAEYRERPHELDSGIAAEPTGRLARAAHGLSLFATARLRVITAIGESRAVQESTDPMIVISASGMATGGRVLHHLRRTLPHENNTILFAGYQAAGTRGRALREGAKLTRIHGEEIPVRARVEALDSMSAHADADEIMRWLRNFRKPPVLTCLVHGEPEPMDTLKARIERELGWTVKTPEPQETMDLP